MTKTKPSGNDSNQGNEGNDQDNQGDSQSTDNTDQTKSDEQRESIKTPSGVDKERWADAVRSAEGQSGGFSGVDPEKRDQLIREKYDQLEASRKGVSDWAGKGGIA